jgi:mediator of RNA polymerase II transcription subunit 12
MVKYPEATLNIIDDAIPLLDSKLQGSDTGPLRRDLTECAAALLRALLAQNSSLVTDYCMQKLAHHSPFTTVLEKAVDLLLGFDLQTRGIFPLPSRAPLPSTNTFLRNRVQITGQKSHPNEQ